jgi:hypothetical protein
MRIPIKFIVLVGLYISVKGKEYKLDSSDPIASEISKILKHTENCNVIIASQNQLEHLDINENVPVLIYVHSTCLKDNRLCLSEQLRKRQTWKIRLTHHCTLIIVPIHDRVSFVEQWNSHEQDEYDDRDDDEDKSRLSFPSELWKAGLQFTNSYDDISYLLLSKHPEDYNYRDSLISSRKSKTRSLNLFAVDVGDHHFPSKYHFMCQFCNELCKGFEEIAMEDAKFLDEKGRSEFIRQHALKKRTWKLDYRYEDLLNDPSMEGRVSGFQETVHRKSSEVNLEQLALLKKLFVVEILFERTENIIGRDHSKCRMSSLKIDHSELDIDFHVPGTEVIWSGSSSFTFLTCHTDQGGIHFDTYITPFDLPTWIGIMVASLLTHFAFATFAWRDNIRHSQFTFLHIILSWLFSFSYSPSKSISKHFWYRVISVAWFFASFVLAMMYTTFAITGVTEPLPEKGVSTFEELTSFRVCRNHTCEDHEFVNYMENQEKGATKEEGWAFDIYSTPIFGANLTLFSFEKSAFGNEIHEFKRYYDATHENAFWNETGVAGFLNVMLPLVFHKMKYPIVNGKHSKDALLATLAEIEKEIVQCQRKVYVDRTDDVLEEYSYLSKHYKWLKFRVSEERKMWSHNYWIFERDFGSRMSKTYNALLEAGILSHLEKSYRNVVNQKRFKHTLENKKNVPEKEQSKFQPSNMKGNIQTIFIVYLILVAVAILVFIIEKTWIPALLTVIRWFYTMEMYINVALISLEVFVLRLRYPRNRR